MRNALLLLLLLALPSRAYPHEGPPYAVVVDRAVGPWVVSVWTDPDVGTGTFYVVFDGGPVPDDMQVEIGVLPSTARLPEARTTAVRERRDPVQFKALVPFDAEERWRVRVLLRGGGSEGVIETEVLVTPPGMGKVGLIFYLLPFLAIGFLWARALLARRRGLRRDPNAHLSRPVEDSYPLTPLQRGMVFHSLYASASGVDVAQLVATLEAPIDPSAFESAWARALERHAVLRTGFRYRGIDEPLQDAATGAPLSIEHHDWRAFATSEQEREVTSWLREDRRRGYDLETPSLTRLALARTGERAWRFLWSFHHIILDGRSIPVVLEEIGAVHDSILRGADTPLPEPRPYREFVEWARGGASAEDLAYWRKELAGFRAPTPLPAARAGTASEEGHARRSILLPAAATSALRSLSQRNGLSVPAFVQGAWAILLARYSGEEDVVFGSTRNLREPGTRDPGPAVGLFLNTVPVRFRLDSGERLLPWLSAMHRSQWLAMRQGRFRTPLVEIEKCSDLPRGTPLFQTLVVLENRLIDEAIRALGGIWEKGKFEFFLQTPYPLTVFGYLGEALLLEIGFDRRSFEGDTIARMLDHLSTLLQGMASDPELPVSSLPMLPESERRSILSMAASDRAGPPSTPQLVDRATEAQALRTPDAVAVVFEGEGVSYAELTRRANRVARSLLRRGVEAEMPVALLVDRSVDMVAGLLGVLKSGGALVPLDPGHPRERLAFLLRDAGCVLAVTQDRFAPLLAGVPGIVRLDADRDEVERENAENLEEGVSADRLAYILHTSGSTGVPKGVEVTHGSLASFLSSMGREAILGAGDVVLAVTPVSFDPFLLDLLSPLLVGARIVILPRSVATDGKRLIRAIEESSATVLQATPSTWRMLLEAGWVGSDRLTMLSGGEALTADLAEELKRRGRCLFNLYGPTETTVWTALHRVETPRDPIPIGRPIDVARMYVLDPFRRPVPIGVVGEIHIGGAGLARGYHRRADLTAERFVPSPFEGDDTLLYRTGDRGVLRTDGAFEFHGRIDRQIKVRGHRVEPEEVESALLQHPRVRQAAVCPHEVAPGDLRLVAHLAGDDGTADLSQSVRSFLADRLPGYMMPARFVWTDALPLTPSGKVDRRALASSEPPMLETSESYISPGDALERKLVEMWEEVLAIRPVGVTDDFFELGGDSLLAVRLFSRIERSFGDSLPLATLFDAPTVRGIAGILRDRRTEPPWSSLVPIQREGTKPPLFCVHGAGGNVLHYRLLARRLGADQPFYGLQPLGLSGKHTPHTKVEEMAEHYLAEIRSVAPSGPYVLAGGSFGGLVAFEMARRLETAGEEVALVAMFHTWAPGSPRPLRNATALPDPVYRTILRARRRLRELASAPLSQRPAALRRILSRDVRAVAGLLGRSYRPALFATQRAILHSRGLYRPQPYGGRIALFRDSEIRPDVCPDPRLGWDGLAPGLECHDIPGKHIEMYEEPHVRLLAERLSLCIEQALRGST